MINKPKKRAGCDRQRLDGRWSLVAGVSFSPFHGLYWSDSIPNQPIGQPGGYRSMVVCVCVYVVGKGGTKIEPIWDRLGCHWKERATVKMLNWLVMTLGPEPKPRCGEVSSFRGRARPPLPKTDRFLGPLATTATPTPRARARARPNSSRPGGTTVSLKN